MKTAYGFVALLFLTIPSLTLAFTSQVGESVNVSAPLFDDFYVAGSRVSIQSKISGDLMMAGGDITSE